MASVTQASLPHYRAQSLEGDLFVSLFLKLPQCPQVHYDDVLSPWASVERFIRMVAELSNEETYPIQTHPFIGMINIFEVPIELRMSVPRPVYTQEDRYRNYFMPLSQAERRRSNKPSMTDSLQEFYRHWRLFSRGCLGELADWSHVIVGGGAIQICLLPMPEGASDDEIQDFYDSNFPESDIDIYIWGLYSQDACAHQVAKVVDALECHILRGHTLQMVVSEYALTLCGAGLRRQVQIVLKVYDIPAEAVTYFDMDAACSVFDGQRVWCCPRAVLAAATQSNRLDLKRYKPNYVQRLAKYAIRGYEIYVPGLERRYHFSGSCTSYLSWLQRLMSMGAVHRELLYLERQFEKCVDARGKRQVLAEFRRRCARHHSDSGTTSRLTARLKFISKLFEKFSEAHV